VRKSPVISRTTTGLNEESRAKLEGLQDRLGDLQESLLLTRVYDDMEDIETALSLLPVEIGELRDRGYVFRSFLENKIGVLSEQWDEAYDRASNEVTRRQQDLERESNKAESALRQAAGGRAAQISRAESATSALERKVSAAQSAVEAMYDSLKQNVNQTRTQVEKIGWMLDQVDEAGFQLHPIEDPVMACQAQYMETKKDGPEGVLYLTDERLIFEQKEEIATKKVLFITTEKEKVQELIFEVLVGQIDEIKSSQKGFLGRKEMLELLFAPEADLSDATLRLHGSDNEEWAGLIGRVKSGEIAKERTKPKDEATVEAARAVPTKCTTCGATLSVEVVRGMREITCEYCGSVIRL
jgi:predicted  nucleic acid-binding Zn-ribbon protein